MKSLKEKLLFLMVLTSFMSTAYAREIDANSYEDKNIKKIEKEIALKEAKEEQKEEVVVEEETPVYSSVDYILDKYNLTSDEFNVLCAVVMGEAKENDYRDAYAVINTIYNRTKSNTWINYVANIMGCDGTNLFNQVVCTGQFEAYYNGRYQKFLGVKDTQAYNAIIDFLVSEEIMHEYLSFVAAYGESAGKEQFVSDGNRYYDFLYEEDKIKSQGR